MSDINFVTFIGVIAGTLTTISFLPQLIRTIKTKSTKDISLGMFVCFCGGLIFWTIYGVLLQSIPIILTNTVTLLLASIILVYKIKYK